MILIKRKQNDKIKNFTYNFGRDVGEIGILYFAIRNEVDNDQYEGLMGSVYQKLKCTYL